MTDDFTVGTHRRYCFLKYKATLAAEDDINQSWDAKRRTLPGTDLPADFPARNALLTAGYLVLEEVEGADTHELRSAGLTTGQAAAVLAALE